MAQPPPLATRDSAAGARSKTVRLLFRLRRFFKSFKTFGKAVRHLNDSRHAEKIILHAVFFISQEYCTFKTGWNLWISKKFPTYF